MTENYTPEIGRDFKKGLKTKNILDQIVTPSHKGLRSHKKLFNLKGEGQIKGEYRVSVTSG